ncbi:hypothetical protein [Nannocystis pusilla]|uniref:hypothetical protein n=1 Tax=Nannocystis pusilla TaxID=889268 RepID=UPI003B7E8808
MDVHRLRNLTFLMSLGGLSAACFTDEGPRGSGTDPGESTGGTTGGGTTDAVDPGTGTTDTDTTTTTTGAVDTTTTTEPATSTTTGPDTTTTDAATTDLTTTDTTGPGPDSDVCMQYGTTYVGCYPRQAEYFDLIVEDCESVVEKGDEVDGPACGKAYEDFWACLASLDCQQLEFEFNQPSFCAIQYELIEEFCPQTGKDFEAAMLFVSGTKRSGTSMWMQVLRAAGFPVLGEAFPRGFTETLHQANPAGFYESILRHGIYFRTNPHPVTGEYFLPEHVEGYVVKVFVPGVIRSERAYITHLIANVREWREYEASILRLYALEREGMAAAGQPVPEASSYFPGLRVVDGELRPRARHQPAPLPGPPDDLRPGPRRPRRHPHRRARLARPRRPGRRPPDDPAGLPYPDPPQLRQRPARAGPRVRRPLRRRGRAEAVPRVAPARPQCDQPRAAPGADGDPAPRGPGPVARREALGPAPPRRPARARLTTCPFRHVLKDLPFRACSFELLVSLRVPRSQHSLAPHAPAATSLRLSSRFGVHQQRTPAHGPVERDFQSLRASRP